MVMVTDTSNKLSPKRSCPVMNQKVVPRFHIINECCCFLMGFSLNSNLFKSTMKHVTVADQKMETVRKIKAEKQV